MKVLKNLGIVAIGVVIIATGVAFGNSFQPQVDKVAEPFGGGRGEAARACTTGTSSLVAVTSASGTLLATSSDRAWARISATGNSTSSVTLAFNAGSVAVVNEGFILTTTGLSLTGVSTTSFIDFGRNTDFVYTGQVTGLTSAGTTQLAITECNY